jgi:excisionase family DNA binding protein
MIEFRVSSLAQALNVHRNTVRNWIKGGRLPAEQTVGKRYFVALEDFVRFCARQKIPVQRIEEFVPEKKRETFYNLLESGNDEVRMPTNPVGAAMVVGGGVAGIQAALDLAESGYYVYMVEKSPGIGGAMAQLDKTFPTNDCAM